MLIRIMAAEMLYSNLPGTRVPLGRIITYRVRERTIFHYRRNRDRVIKIYTTCQTRAPPAAVYYYYHYNTRDDRYIIVVA